MKLIRPLLLCCLFCFATHLSSQDLHWTLFNFSPLTLNPGFTGAYEGSFRIGGIVRDQTPSGNFSNNVGVSNVYFPTYAFYIDSPVVRGFRKQDWVGIGGTFYSNKAGDLGLGLTYGLGSIAYHIGLNKKSTSTFTIGIQGGAGSRKLDTRTLLLETDIRGTIGVNVPAISEKGGNFFDLNAGLLLRSQVDKNTGFNLGLNFRHILTAEYALISSNIRRDSADNDLPLTLAFHGQLDTKLNKKWSLTPAFMVQNASPSTEIQLQGMLGYLFNPEKNVTLNFGLGYRIGDAGQFLVGLDYGAFRATASFDLTLSSAREVNRSIGGFELGVSYIGRIYKDPTVKPVIFCPRF